MLIHKKGIYFMQKKTLLSENIMQITRFHKKGYINKHLIALLLSIVKELDWLNVQTFKLAILCVINEFVYTFLIARFTCLKTGGFLYIE